MADMNGVGTGRGVARCIHAPLPPAAAGARGKLVHRLFPQLK